MLHTEYFVLHTGINKSNKSGGPRLDVGSFINVKCKTQNVKVKSKKYAVCSKQFAVDVEL